MRAFALLLLLTIPPLVVCSAAYAKTSVEIGKPVCTHYDDAAKSARQSAVVGASTNPVATTASATAVTPAIVATVSPVTSARNASVQPKTGGTSGMMRPHDGPRWQTFLPGMFK
jgi:hypothetical protein